MSHESSVPWKPLSLLFLQPGSPDKEMWFNDSRLFWKLVTDL